jgi:hypothetical protein
MITNSNEHPCKNYVGNQNPQQQHRSYSSPKPMAQALGYVWIIEVLTKSRLQIDTNFKLMNELQDRIIGSRMFTTIDLKNGYHLIRIKEGDEWKTAFRCRYGLYEFLVMPFGLTNAPVTFQDMINHIFRDLLDNGVIAFIDDILIYAKDEEEHHRLVEEVLKQLSQTDLVIFAEKCTWSTQRVEFLGYVITPEGMEMANDKVETIQSWQIPQSLRDVQSFLGFANFHTGLIN